jgi:hypothetical protein
MDSAGVVVEGRMRRVAAAVDLTRQHARALSPA